MDTPIQGFGLRVYSYLVGAGKTDAMLMAVRIGSGFNPDNPSSPFPAVSVKNAEDLPH